MSIIGNVISAMILYYAGDMKRINHFLKVYSFARSIGDLENLDESTQLILEIAAVTHDIGIKNSEKRYSSSAGNYQQIEGPPEARRMLEELDIEKAIIDRVCWLIAHHHTYKDIHGIDYQILIEADFLVNAFEDSLPIDSIIRFGNSIFKTESGNKLLSSCFLLNAGKSGDLL